MNIDNLIREIFKKNGSISKVDTSILIQTILCEYFDKNQIKYKKRTNEPYEFDLILENDFQNHRSPCGVEIFVDLERIFLNDYKNIRKKIDQEFELKKTQSIIFNFINKDQFNSIIFVTLLDQDEALTLENKLLSSYSDSGLHLKVYSKDFINSILIELKDHINDIVDKIFSTKLHNFVFSKNEDWKIKRDDLITLLKTQYKNSGKCSLLLGAGISCSANLPSWDELISSLFTTYLINSTDSEELKNMSLKDYKSSITHISKSISGKYIKSALLSARYLQKGFSTQDNENDEFIIHLQKCLYKNQIKKSQLIYTIGKLCVPTRVGAKINSIITYNFDNLIEMHLDEQKLKYKSIFLDNIKYQNEELPIYHVHGYIPKDLDLKKSKEITQDMDLIFSEAGYHRMYSSPYHWSNLIQISTLRDNTCIMIGLSLDDPNLRRLLEIAQTGSNAPKHFAFLKRISIEEFSEENKSKETLSLHMSFLERHHNLQELMFSELGINIIWFEEFEELSQLLGQLLN